MNDPSRTGLLLSAGAASKPGGVASTSATKGDCVEGEMTAFGGEFDAVAHAAADTTGTARADETWSGSTWAWPAKGTLHPNRHQQHHLNGQRPGQHQP